MNVPMGVLSFGAVVVLSLSFFLSSKYLSKQRRYMLYGAILLPALIALLYAQYKNANPFDYALELSAEGLEQPVLAIWGPDKTNRFFIVGRQGVIHIMDGNQRQRPPFLDIRGQVNSTGVEQGLLSAAFHPNFVQNGIFYVYYTGLDGSVVLARYHTFPDNRELADPESALMLLTIPKQTENHNGGTLLFGPDGYLYISIGDDAEYELSAAQKLDTHLGKILRLDVSDENIPYKIPEDNPFVNTPTALPEIWAYGLRNAWRMAFDLKTGDLYITDVGSLEREEVNFQSAETGGLNYGWPWYEGNKSKKLTGSDTVDPQGFVFPVIDYEHNTSGGCAIIGGHVYYGNSLPHIKGKYLFSDYCYGYIWALHVDEAGQGTVETLMRDAAIHPSAFAVDGEGEFYLLDFTTGNMLKLVRRPSFLCWVSARNVCPN